MLANCIVKLFNYKYVANKRSKEIHDLSNSHVNCHISMIKNKKYLTYKGMKRYLNKGYNGCRYCLKDFDKE